MKDKYISLKRLLWWKKEIQDTFNEGLSLSLKYANNVEISKYYLGLAKISDNQLALINRLINEAKEKL
jgi:hypothetical protein